MFIFKKYILITFSLTYVDTIGTARFTKKCKTSKTKLSLRIVSKHDRLFNSYKIYFLKKCFCSWFKGNEYLPSFCLRAFWECLWNENSHASLTGLCYRKCNDIAKYLQCLEKSMYVLNKCLFVYLISTMVPFYSVGIYRTYYMVSFKVVKLNLFKIKKYSYVSPICQIPPDHLNHRRSHTALQVITWTL